MPAELPRAIQDGWGDAEDSHVSLFDWSSRSLRIPSAGCCSPGWANGERSSAGALVAGVLYVRFEGEGQLISMPPQLVRLLLDEPGER